MKKTKKNRYEVFANGEKQYTYSNSPINAYMNIFKRVKKEQGFCKITDMRIETLPNVYVRFIWKHPERFK